MFLRKSIKVPIYVGKFDIVIMDDTKQYDKLYIHPFGKDYVFGHSIETSLKGNDYTHFVMILNFNYKNNKITHGIVAHEALHIAGFILDHVGVKYDFDNDEPFTYLIQWVTDQVYKFLNYHKIQF